MEEARRRAVTASEIVSTFVPFFRRFVTSGADYIVVMSRRCQNLMELLACLDSWDDFVQYDRVLTENGLMMEAEGIVQTYAETGCLPRIAIMDDVLVHGRSLSRLLVSMQNLLRECLRDLGVERSEKEFHLEFCRSVTIWVYAVNDTSILLKKDYQWSMMYAKICPAEEWRGVSRGISNYILNGEVANTCYVLSASFPAEHVAHAPEAAAPWAAVGQDTVRYGADPYFSPDNRAVAPMTLFFLPMGTRDGLYPCVRSYVRGSRRYFTPYVFLPEMGRRQMEQIVGWFDERIRQPQARAWLDRTRRAGAHPARGHVYVQAVELLLSQMVLRLFLDEHLDKNCRLETVYDTEKIGRNFGWGAAEELAALSTISWTWDDLTAVFCAAGFTPKVRQVDAVELGDPVSGELVVEAMEDAAYERALRHERHARMLEHIYSYGGEVDISELDAMDADRTGEESFSRFMDDTRQKLTFAEPTDTTLLALSCLLQMMDAGDVSLKARMSDSGQFYSAVRVTEMSLSILPRRLAGIFNDFYWLAQYYWRDRDFFEQIHRRTEAHFRFIREIPENEIAYYTHFTDKLTRFLQKNKSIVRSMLAWTELYR